MADNTVTGFGKDPLTASHGDSLADQSFQSLKSKEIRDSMSPTEMKFHSMTLNNPNTSGWNVQSSKEVSPDGRGFRAETVATTDGVESIKGGIAEFQGYNDQRSSAHHEGDDKNFIKKAQESSKSHLQEKVVIGDENSGRTEVRSSSSTSTSSSQVIQSSTNIEFDDGVPIQHHLPQKYLVDPNSYQHKIQHRQQQELQRIQEEQRIYEQQFQEQHQQNIKQEERRISEQLSTVRQSTEHKNTSQNVQTQELHEHNKRYVDMDKASPEYQQHVQYLMQQPGEIISKTVEYPKPNVKMTTTVKRLPDGTIVRNKRYETEELPPTAPTNRSTSTSTNQTNLRRNTQQQQTRNHESDSAPQSRPSADMVDNSDASRHFQDVCSNDIETKFSSTKKSSRKFSTETTSEIIQESHSFPEKSRIKPVTNDFSTHGFPSVRENKPTQEYPTDRPKVARPTQGYPSQSMPRPSEVDTADFSTHGFPSVRENKPTQEYLSDRPKAARLTQRYPSQSVPKPSEVDTADFSTHGFPSVRENKPTQEYPSDRPKAARSTQGYPSQSVPRPSEVNTTDFSTHGFPSVKENKPTQEYPTDHPKAARPTQGYPSQSMPRPSEVDTADFSTHGFPSVRENKPTQEYPTDRPKAARPTQGYPSQSVPRPSEVDTADFSTHGFPSVRENKPTQEYPSDRPKAARPTQGYPSQSMPSPSEVDTADFSTHGFPSVRENKPTQEYPTDRPKAARPTQGYPSQSMPRPSEVDTSDNITERRIPTKDGELIIVSSEKKHNYKTQTNLERTIETEHHIKDDQQYQEISDKTKNFTTRGFPSVKEPIRQTKNYPDEKQMQPRDQNHPIDKLSPSTRIIKPSHSPDDDVVVITSQKSHTSKHSVNSERIIEHEIIRDDQGYPNQIPRGDSPKKATNPDYSTQGFPSVRTPTKATPVALSDDYSNQGFPSSGTPSKTAPHKQTPHNETHDFPGEFPNQNLSTLGYPSVRFPDKSIPSSGYPSKDPSQKFPTHRPDDNTPHGDHPGLPKKPLSDDYSTQGYPSSRTPSKTAPHQQTPYVEIHESPRKSPSPDFSTHGFPSVGSRTKPTTSQGPADPTPYDDYPGSPKKPLSDDYSTQGYPSVKTSSRFAPHEQTPHGQSSAFPRKSPDQDFSTHGFPSAKSPTKMTPGQTHGKPGEKPVKTQPRAKSPNKYTTPNSTKDTTERIIRKEKELDSAHRAFAASLRSSSPIDNIRRESYTVDSHTRHTPRSSVSSSKTFRRDMREGSHESAPSETSRISNTTLTRNTPPRTIGGRNVVTKVVTTKIGRGSNETINSTSPRATKSPSPGKTVTTTTATRTVTRKTPAKEVPKLTDNQHTRNTTNKNNTLFSINDPLTKAKIKFSDNHKKHKPNSNKRVISSPPPPPLHKEIIEAPCIKKHYYLLGPSDPPATALSPYQIPKNSGKTRSLHIKNRQNNKTNNNHKTTTLTQSNNSSGL